MDEEIEADEEEATIDELRAGPEQLRSRVLVIVNDPFFGTDIRMSVVAAGSIHSLAIDNHGRLWSWGDGDFGKLGHLHANRPQL